MAKKIYIGNLNFATTEEELKSYFEKFGEVVSSTVIKDKFSGLSKGFGFIEMTLDDDAQKAISEINGKDINGRRVRVSFAQERPQRKKSI